jgi:putative ABC transport system substrate-binding protein
MRRRDFVIALGSVAAVSAPLLGRAQQTGKTYRIAFVAVAAPVAQMIEDEGDANGTVGPLLEELRRRGYVKGRNLVVERYSGEGKGRFAELAAEVIRSKPDLIIDYSNAQTMAFKAATTTIPIVAMTGDPVAIGLVSSLAHPGGNITGVTEDAGIQTYGKRLEILRETVPSASRVAFLATRVRWQETTGGAPMREAADRLGITLLGPPLESPLNGPEVQRVMAAMVQQGTDAMVVDVAAENWRWRQLIVEQAAKYRLPAIYPYRVYVDLGGLMAYAIDLADMGRHMAMQIDQILQGAKPADVPIYQSIGWQLIINLKTAKALGIEIPGSIRTRADEVIE